MNNLTSTTGPSKEVLNRATIIKTGRLEIGYYETPPGSNKTKYGEWFGYNGVAWCGIFVSYVYSKAGLSLGNIGFLKGFAGCDTAVAHFRKTNEITMKPQTGDIVFFDWNGDNKFDHVGIYLNDIDGKTFATIEGNTSLVNNSNGGAVMERRRNNKNVLFVSPLILKK